MRMICLDDERLSALHDGVGSPEDQRHADACAECSARLTGFDLLGSSLRALPRERAAASLHAMLDGLAAGASTESRQSRSRALIGLVAALASAAALVIAPETGSFSTALADEAVTHHLRAFAQGDGSGCEVESSDPGAVATWLSDALGADVEVPVVPGAELVGARRCSLFGERAGAVVYRTPAGAVTLFVPAPGSEAERACERSLGCTEARDGQRVCVVRGAGGSPRLVVGELPPGELCAVAGQGT